MTLCSGRSSCSYPCDSCDCCWAERVFRNGDASILLKFQASHCATVSPTVGTWAFGLFGVLVTLGVCTSEWMIDFLRFPAENLGMASSGLGRGGTYHLAWRQFGAPTVKSPSVCSGACFCNKQQVSFNCLSVPALLAAKQPTVTQHYNSRPTVTSADQ